ncbi:hypothetical protein SAMN05216428_10795 [Nitrosospira sp. Nsp11]|nr:hypothetical protein SAMN05216428_10795 [Nitrosospira sp. Nsp11]
MTRTLELVSRNFIELKQGIEGFRLLSSIFVIFEQAGNLIGANLDRTRKS